MTQLILSPVWAINNSGEIWMHRQPFAEKLGEAIVEWRQPDSPVIGLYGRWGSGKSSKNVCIEFLKKKKDCRKILEFSPWLFNSEGQLNDTFFKELGSRANSFKVTKQRKQFEAD